MENNNDVDCLPLDDEENGLSPAKKFPKKSTGREKKSKQGVRQNYVIREIIPVNEKLFSFYRQQQIIPESEWDDFVAALRRELPVSFRIQCSLRERDHLDEYIQSKFVKEIENIAKDSPEIDPPKRVPFVPYAYQTKMSRASIRGHPILKDLHEFLINETELGYISRQEVCSMIPPLFLDIQPHHLVLDACAAPGSKTAQIIELMHVSSPNPSGMVVANDIDYKRCYLLVHQTLKRMPTADVVVVSHDSGQFPVMIDSNKQPLLFDRILCDVICSGDGTFRKNPELWNNWEPMKGIHLHKLQLQIARRCFELLKPGGLMCYSTCSLNPLEDEAVIAQLLRHFNKEIELVDISGKILDLKRTKGISHWKVFNKNLEEYSSIDDVPKEALRHFKPSMFPPKSEEIESMHLDYCFRILPHQQDTGGFFVAILRRKEIVKVNLEKDCADEQQQQPLKLNQPSTLIRKSTFTRKRRGFVNKEDPFIFLANHSDENELREALKEYFGILPENFSHQNLLVRSTNTERKKEVYYVNNSLKEFLINNDGRFKIVNAGMGILKKIINDKVSPCPYRIKQDGLPILIPWITKRIIDIPTSLFIRILHGGQTNLKEKETSQYLPLIELGEEEHFLFKGLEPGTIILRLLEPFPKEVCAWIGANSISAFVSREERFHLLCILGEDIIKLKRKTVTCRQEKAAAKLNKEKDLINDVEESNEV
uniref:tRNA (cytosine(34)-C(5))-methyltransferase n=1 Tax=Meloidogyne enterolobii TaxID=390850 RepID=A0A6V7TQA9_MELEN|nr:unnamed protein product [Meloidogyne enterolobii]